MGVIVTHAYFQLGKQDARRDDRNLLLASVLREQPTLPPSYDFDAAHETVPLFMFANDRYGDCVMAARAHQTLRFEKLETGITPMITDKQVLTEYWRETGGVGNDTGLVMLDSLNEWRHKGWRLGVHTYKIMGYAEVARADQNAVMQAIYADVGVQCGLQLPISAQTQIDRGQPWILAIGDNAKPGSWGGHCVYIVGYTSQGPVCVTWGRKQQMTWEFFRSYCDEAYAVFDAKDTWRKGSIDQGKVAAFLAAL